VKQIKLTQLSNEDIKLAKSVISRLLRENYIKLLMLHPLNRSYNYAKLLEAVTKLFSLGPEKLHPIQMDASSQTEVPTLG
jgi:hypothetical protein